MPNNNVAYSTKKYWVERYQQDSGYYDWFGSFEGEMKATLKKLIDPSESILNLGLLSEPSYERLWK